MAGEWPTRLLREAGVSLIDCEHRTPPASESGYPYIAIPQINQMANYALLEWPENLAISDAPPSKYVLEIQGRFSAAKWDTMQELHALPDGWEKMAYPVFLDERRKSMAAIIRRGFDTLR